MIESGFFFEDALRAHEAIQATLRAFARVAETVPPASYAEMFAEACGRGMGAGFLAGLSAARMPIPRRIRPPRRAARRRHNRKLKGK